MNVPGVLGRLAQSVSAAAIALCISAAGGLIFLALHIPLPWTLGALTAAAIAATSFNRWPMPPALRNLAAPVIGVLAGSAFTPEILSAIPHWWPAVLFVIGYTLVNGVIGYFIFTRIFRCDKVTSFFAVAPGGLGELTVLGGALGGNMRTLVLVHTMRIITIIFGIPIILQLITRHSIGSGAVATASAAHDWHDWAIIVAAGLAGYLFGKWARFPGAIMITPMLCSAFVHALGLTDAAPPAWLVAFVQILIGGIVGARFAGLRLAELRTTALIAIMWSVIMLANACVAAKIGTWLLGRPFESLLLAISPGGAGEMIVITYALGADVAFVATCQLCRVFLVMLGAPFVFRLLKVAPPPPE